MEQCVPESTSPEKHVKAAIGEGPDDLVDFFQAQSCLPSFWPRVGSVSEPKALYHWIVKWPKAVVVLDHLPETPRLLNAELTPELFSEPS